MENLGYKCKGVPSAEVDNIEDGDNVGASINDSDIKCSSTPLRKQSSVSENSINSAKSIYPPLTCDSGNYSSSSNISDYNTGAESLEFESSTNLNGERFQHVLREKEQALSSALQEIRKLGSELKRVNSSEQWYKEELKAQKITRLEALERLYTQERKYMQENQRLQRECMQLYEKYRAMATEMECQRAEALKGASKTAGSHKAYEKETDKRNSFETEQQKSLISEQEQLIEVLRKQKQTLLEELKRLTDEKVASILELQQTVASMEVENTRIVTKCKHLLNEKKDLEERLKLKESDLEVENTEKLKLQDMILDLKRQLCAQQKSLTLKESEMFQIQDQFRNAIKTEFNSDEVHRLNVVYLDEMNAKTAEISSLKCSLASLQQELTALADLQTKNDEQERLIENLQFSLDTRAFELDKLKQTDGEKSQQIDELQLDVIKFRNEREQILQELSNAKFCIKSKEKDLISLNERYADMCALCERTRFNLDMIEITRRKLELQTDDDKKQIEGLQKKLSEYLHKITELSKRIVKLEAELALETKVKSDIEQKLRMLDGDTDIEKTDKEVANDDPITFATLKEELAKKQELLTKLEIENDQLKSKLNASMEDEHAKIDEAALNAQSKILLDNVQTQSDLISTKATILEQFSNIIGNKSEMIDQIETVCNENRQNKIQLAEKEQDHLKLREYLQANLNECKELKEKLHEECEVTEKLRSKLIQKDAELYKVQKCQEEFTQESEEICRHLRLEKEKLLQEMKSVIEEKLQIEKEYKQIKQLAEELGEQVKKAKNESTMKMVQDRSSSLTADKDVQTDMQETLMLSCDTEVKGSARQGISEDHTLNDSMREEERRMERISLIKNMLQQQNARMQHLGAMHGDWEEVLQTLNRVQKLEENTRSELELKTAELEKLNLLFAEQNRELTNLHHLSALIEKNEEPIAEETFQQQQQANVIQSETDCRLSKEVNDSAGEKLLLLDNCCQTSANDIDDDDKKQIAILQNKVDLIMRERNEYAAKIKVLEQQLFNQRQNKREAIVLDTTSVDGDNPELTNAHLRILTKVLEAEYKRKMKRYDEHIRTLLSNVKSLKRALKVAESRATLLSTNQNPKHDEDVQITKRHLEEMRLKFEHSQNVVKALESELVMERQKFAATDVGKSTIIHEEPTHEVANLIDDYKKLIQQSAVISCRPKTSAILELIQRSNQYVPNFSKLESTVEDLRSDIQQFIASCAVNNIDGYSYGPTLQVPSLMDELRAAAEKF